MNTNGSYEAAYRAHLSRVDEALEAQLSDASLHPTMREAMRHSVFPGGKRLRPVLTLATDALFDGDGAKALPLACAIELIHSYSLVHDDLPAMDDDDTRRGHPATHIAFGEANGILAGDALLNLAFEGMLDALPPDNPGGYLRAMRRIAHASGARGMIAGQCDDLFFEGKTDLSPDDLERVHRKKTGAILSAAVMAGALANDAPQDACAALEDFGAHLGLCFQITDDILDVIGDPMQMGKTLGKDEKADKLTFVRIYGLEEARGMAADHTERAVAALESFGSKADFLRTLALKMGNRQN